MQEIQQARKLKTISTCRLIRPVVVLMAFLSAPQTWSEGQHDLLLFLSAGPTYNEVTPEQGPDGTDFAAAADVVYSYTHDRFRFLGEYVATTDESELERFKFGWQTGENTTGWIGRFHSPSRYWNAIYHHGQYLQTSITRPLIEQFEDDGGVLPTHITGFMLDTSSNLKQESGIQAVLSFGAAPVIGEDALEPFNLLDSDSDHGAAADLRLALLPDLLGDNQVGLILSWADLKIDENQTAEQLGLLRVEQYTIGAYLDWRWEDWRILTSVAYVDNQDELQTQTLKDDFVSGYLQAEYYFHPNWILYGRLEESSGTEDSLYLTLFPNTIADRQVLGLRFDFAKLQAITLEVTRTIEFAGADTQTDRFGQMWLQWSTVLPWAW
jgi:hypothetical protein